MRFTRDALTQPLEIRVAAARPPEDAPLALTAQARFLENGEPQPVCLVGNTTLEIVTFDPDTALPLDMPTAALRLQQMMNEMTNALPTLAAGVRRDARLLLEAVVRFAHTVLDDLVSGGREPPLYLVERLWRGSVGAGCSPRRVGLYPPVT